MKEIPKYDTLMLPLLKLLEDGKPHDLKDLVNTLAKEFDLGSEELSVMLEHGNRSLFYTRVGWARTYLKFAALLFQPERSVLKITSRGKEVLDSNIAKINKSFLMEYSEFADFCHRKKKTNPPTNGEDYSGVHKETPEDLMASAYIAHKNILMGELLEKIKKMSPEFFERLVVELLVKMGYGGAFEDSALSIGKTGDEGIDGIIKEDKLGLDIIYIQAKRWDATPVGRPDLQKFVGAVMGKGGRKGVFITTSNFSKDAKDYNPQNMKLVRLDGEQIANLMIDYNLGVSIAHSYDIKKIDTDYFEEY